MKQPYTFGKVFVLGICIYFKGLMCLHNLHKIMDSTKKAGQIIQWPPTFMCIGTTVFFTPCRRHLCSTSSTVIEKAWEIQFTNTSLQVCGHLTIMSICGSSPNCWDKLSWLSLNAVAIQFPVNGTKSPKHVPAWLDSFAQCKAREDMVFQSSCRRTRVAYADPWSQPH